MRVKLPTRTSGLKYPCGRSLLSPVALPPVTVADLSPREVPIRHCSGWGLPCQSCCQSCGGLLPHRFTITMANHGCLFSVALSLRLPSPGVTRHPYFMESGLSSKGLHPPRSSSHPREARHRACINRRQAALWGAAKRSAKSQAIPASTASSGPVWRGLKRRRKADSRASSSTSG